MHVWIPRDFFRYLSLSNPITEQELEDEMECWFLVRNSPGTVIVCHPRNTCTLVILVCTKHKAINGHRHTNAGNVIDMCLYISDLSKRRMWKTCVYETGAAIFTKPLHETSKRPYSLFESDHRITITLPWAAGNISVHSRICSTATVTVC